MLTILILTIIANVVLLDVSNLSTVMTDEVKSDVSIMLSLYTQPTTRPVTEASFEFGDFQGSSTTSASTITTWPTSSTTFSEDASWASFESAFPPSNPPATSNVPTAVTQNYTSTLTTTTTTTAATTTTTTATTTTVNSSGPGQFAVFDEVRFPPTIDSSTVDNVGDDTAGDNGDKYAAFASLVTTTTHTDDDFGNFEGGQLPSMSNSDVVKVQYFTTQVSVWLCYCSEPFMAKISPCMFVFVLG